MPFDLVDFFSIRVVVRQSISMHEGAISFIVKSVELDKLVATLAYLDQELALLDSKIKRECEDRR